MDPDVAYTRLFEAAAEWQRLYDNQPPYVGDRKQWAQDLSASGVAMADAFDALDGWLKMGGHAPKAWDQRLRSR